MKSIVKPLFTARETFKICIDRIVSSELKEKLRACEELITEAEVEFEDKISLDLIHTIIPESLINGNVSSKELKKVYTQRMVPIESPGRGIYNKLFSSPKHGICPICSHNMVETLDHYLPKSKFPRLVVTPINLVPSCFSCNKSKLASTANGAEFSALHPYYDNIQEYEWLSANIIHTTPPSINYFVNSPAEWTDILKSRVEHHFKTLHLNKLYSPQAAVLIRSLNKNLNNIYSEKGRDGVKKYLKDEAISRYETDKNSWQTAFYTAAYQDRWFCDGGFRIA